jgi:cytochrome c-type biogenesis protein CcmF
LLFLTGVGPLLAWRKSTFTNLRYQFLWPVLGTVLTLVATTMLRLPFWAAGACFALCAFVMVTILQEFVRGASVRRRATGTDLFTALVGLFARSRRRYGGYVVHVGIVLIFLGFAGNGFPKEEKVQLKPNQQVIVGKYTVKYMSLGVTDDGQKQMVTAHVEASRDGKLVAQMYPARWFYRGREDEPTTEVALRRTVSEDLYVVLAAYEVSDQSVTLSVKVNPLVTWIWIGVGVMAIGTIVALLPEAAFAFATSRVPESAVTTSLILLFFLWTGAARLRAQHIESAQTVSVVPRTPLEKNLQTEIICMCGTCGRKRVGECTCSKAVEMQEEIRRLTAEGKTHDQIIQYYLAKYGSQEVLSSPIDKGFNRLAWFLPYAAGLAGVVFIGGMALRWSRKTGAHDKAPVTAGETNPDLERQLDDELRDLD